ncbi:MAG: GEVED domain-containing protein [Bacteroidota bacterium]
MLAHLRTPPRAYATNISNGGEGPGPAHTVLPDFSIGATIDHESDGRPSTDALGDAAGGDDEDGVDLPDVFYLGQTSVQVPVDVLVPSGTDAQVVGWIDWNGDGNLSPGEAVTSSIVVGETGSAQQVVLTFDVPADANTTQPLGARFRLFDVNETVMTATGIAPLGGEVEDYLVGVRPCPTQNCQ